MAASIPSTRATGSDFEKIFSINNGNTCTAATVVYGVFAILGAMAQQEKKLDRLELGVRLVSDPAKGTNVPVIYDRKAAHRQQQAERKADAERARELERIARMNPSGKTLYYLNSLTEENYANNLYQLDRLCTIHKVQIGQHRQILEDKLKQFSFKDRLDIKMALIALFKKHDPEFAKIETIQQLIDIVVATKDFLRKEDLSAFRKDVTAAAIKAGVWAINDELYD